MSFKLKISTNEYRVLEGYSLSKVQRTLQPSAPFKLENRVTLRAGLQYDEAWLCLGPLSDSNYSALNQSNNVTIIIGTWETNNWICQGLWKVGCGNSAIYVARFVDSRFLLVEHPAPAVSALATESAVTNYRGSTVEFQRHFETETLEKALLTCLYPTAVHNQRIASKGTWKAPWGTGNATWESHMGRISDISLVDKTTLHFAQYLLDHYDGLLVKDYSAANGDPKLDIVAWDSGSEISEPYLCSWRTAGPLSWPHYEPLINIVDDARLQPANGPALPTTFVGNLQSPFSFGKRNQSYEYTDIDSRQSLFSGSFTGSFSLTPLYLSLARHYNRDQRGYVKPGYEGVRPSGLFDTVVYANEMTTYIRQAVPRPEYHQRPRNEVFRATTGNCGLHPGKVGEISVDHYGETEAALCENISNHYIPPNVSILVFRNRTDLRPVGLSDPNLPAWSPWVGVGAAYVTGISSYLIPPTFDPGVDGTLWHSGSQGGLHTSDGTNNESDCYPAEPEPEGPGGEEPPPP